jgi:hypothetical protein
VAVEIRRCAWPGDAGRRRPGSVERIGVSGKEGRHDVGEVGGGFDALEPAGLEDGEQVGRPVTAVLTGDEEPTLPTDSDGTLLAFGGVAVER